MSFIYFTFENNPKQYSIAYSPESSTYEELLRKAKEINYESQDYRDNCHFFNTATSNYIDNISSLLSSSSCNALLFKNYLIHSHAVIAELQSVNKTLRKRSIPKGFDPKKILFGLMSYSNKIPFAEALVSLGAIPLILEVIEVTTGSNQYYTLETFDHLLLLMNSFEYIKRNPAVFTRFYHIVFSNLEQISSIGLMFKTLRRLIANQEKGVELFIESALDYSKQHKTKLCSEMIGFFDADKGDGKVEVVETIVLLLEKTSKNKRLQSKLFVDFKEAGLLEALQRSSAFKLKKYHELSLKLNEICKGVLVGYDLDLNDYKVLLSKYEEQIRQMQCQCELLQKEKRFYVELIDDFIALSKSVEESRLKSLSFDHYTPTERHGDAKPRSSKTITSSNKDELGFDTEVLRFSTFKASMAQAQELEELKKQNQSLLEEIENVKQNETQRISKAISEYSKSSIPNQITTSVVISIDCINVNANKAKNPPLLSVSTMNDISIGPSAIERKGNSMIVPSVGDMICFSGISRVEPMRNRSNSMSKSKEDCKVFKVHLYLKLFLAQSMLLKLKQRSRMMQQEKRRKTCSFLSFLVRILP